MDVQWGLKRSPSSWLSFSLTRRAEERQNVKSGGCGIVANSIPNCQNWNFKIALSCQKVNLKSQETCKSGLRPLLHVLQFANVGTKIRHFAKNMPIFFSNFFKPRFLEGQTASKKILLGFFYPWSGQKNPRRIFAESHYCDF